MENYVIMQDRPKIHLMDRICVLLLAKINFST